MTTSYKLLITTSYKTTSYKPLIILNINFSNVFSINSTCTVGRNYKRDSSSHYNDRSVLYSLSSIMINHIFMVTNVLVINWIIHFFWTSNKVPCAFHHFKLDVQVVASIQYQGRLQELYSDTTYVRTNFSFVIAGQSCNEDS